MLRLAKDLAVDLDLLRRHHVVQLYDGGHDKLAEEVILCFKYAHLNVTLQHLYSRTTTLKETTSTGHFTVACMAVCMVKSHLLNPQEIYWYNSDCEGLYKYNAHSNASMFHSVYFFNTIHMC